MVHGIPTISEVQSVLLKRVPYKVYLLYWITFQIDILKIRIWTWNFVWRFVMLFESLMRKMKKIHPWKSKCVKKLVGRIDPSRFEVLKQYRRDTFFSVSSEKNYLSYLSHYLHSSEKFYLGKRYFLILKTNIKVMRRLCFLTFPLFIKVIITTLLVALFKYFRISIPFPIPFRLLEAFRIRFHFRPTKIQVPIPYPFPT